MSEPSAPERVAALWTLPRQQRERELARLSPAERASVAAAARAQAAREREMGLSLEARSIAASRRAAQAELIARQAEGERGWLGAPDPGSPDRTTSNGENGGEAEV